jgi:membrane protein implicated in regulation of membrane protease activity
MIMVVEDDGEVLVLDDGTRWRVRAGDIPTACTWLPSENVEVTERADGLHEIRRLSDGQSVLATPE